MSVVAVDYERILAGEGLAPIDRSEHHRQSPTLADRELRVARRKETADPARAEAVDAWTQWARDVLRSHAFDTDHQRSVWKLYAAGRTLTQIKEALFLSRRAVTRAIERVERWAPPGPVGNPWNKQQRPRWETPEWRREAQVRGLLLRTNRRVAVRVCMLALRCADKERLRAIFGTDENLLRLVPPDESEAREIMAEAKRTHYDLIQIKQGHDVQMPRLRGAGARSRDRFMNVEGKPHAGGIDIELETKDAGGRPTVTTTTLPWDIIAKADRSRPDDGAAAE